MADLPPPMPRLRKKGKQKMTSVKQHLDLLGLEAEDKVTGVKGVVSSITFDLYGCIQASITPRAKEDGTRVETFFYDVPRIRIIGEEPVMELPNFDLGYVSEGKKGAAEKPAFKK